MLFAEHFGLNHRSKSELAGPMPRAMGRQTIFAIAALSVTQIIGWGSLLFMPAVLAPFIQADLGMAPEIVFGGVALMYFVGAMSAPFAGSLIDRWGACFVMSAGSLAGAIGLGWLAHADGPASYFAAWSMLGVTCATALTSAACAAVFQAAGAATLRGLTALMFVTGLAGTISLPAVHILNSAYGWRGACVALAALHLAVCLPIHLALARPLTAAGASRSCVAPAADGWNWPRQRPAFLALSLALSLNVFVTAGLSVHLVGLLRTFGFSDAIAVSLASLVGLTQVAARAVQFMAGRRWLPTSFALAGAALLPIAMAVMLLPLAVARVDVFIATGFVMLLGLSNGLMMVARTAVPLEIFGAAHYGMWTGKLGASQNAAAAIAPLVFAAVLGRGGAVAALLLAGAAALLSLAAIILIIRQNAASRPSEACR